MAKRTVAIVGGHIKTRNFAPWERKDIDFWLFNEAVSLGWPKRCDGVFQMHDAAVWKNPLNINDPNYYGWLRQRHAFPIYMQKRYGEVPSSVRYPLEGVLRLAGNLKRGNEAVEHCTSTVAFAIALAIYKGYGRIELYGVEMESNTEWQRQRNGVYFWIGVALGRGVEVVIHPVSGLFDEPLYGYEGDMEIGREQLEGRLAILKPLAAKALEKLEKANEEQGKTLDEAMDETGGEAGLAEAAVVRRYMASIKAQAGAMIDCGMLDGAVEEVVRYLRKADAMDEAAGAHRFYRGEFEIVAAQANNQKEVREHHMALVGGQASTAWKALEEGVRGEAGEARLLKLTEAYAQAHQEYLKAAYAYGHISGVVNENVTLLAMVDTLIEAAGGERAVEMMQQVRGEAVQAVEISP